MNPSENVEWRDIPGWEGQFAVSNYGDVKNVKTDNVLKCYPDKYGYLVVLVRARERRKHFKIHTLVLSTFVGPKPEDMHCCRHLDGNNQNNYVGNLKWGTNSENAQDMVRHGFIPRGPTEKRSLSKKSRRNLSRIMKKRWKEKNKKSPTASGKEST